MAIGLVLQLNLARGSIGSGRFAGGRRSVVPSPSGQGLLLCPPAIDYGSLKSDGMIVGA